MGRRWHQIGRGLAASFQRFSPGPDVRPFVILFVPRTGSNLLAGILDSHPEILCHHELFLPDAPHRSLSVREGTLSLDLGTAEQRDRDPWAFLRRVFASNEGSRAVGFKMALSDVNVGVVLAMILNRGIRKIIVRRDNWLHVYTSALIAEQTQSLIRFRDGSRNGDVTTPTRVTVDVERFMTYARKRRVSYALTRWIARLTLQRFLEVEYGDMKKPEKLREILEFLGVAPDLPVRERTTKQNPQRLGDRIENYPEVVERLRGSRYGRFLD